MGTSSWLIVSLSGQETFLGPDVGLISTDFRSFSANLKSREIDKPPGWQGHTTFSKLGLFTEHWQMNTEGWMKQVCFCQGLMQVGGKLVIAAVALGKKIWI